MRNSLILRPLSCLIPFLTNQTCGTLSEPDKFETQFDQKKMLQSNKHKVFVKALSAKLACVIKRVLFKEGQQRNSWKAAFKMD